MRGLYHKKSPLYIEGAKEEPGITEPGADGVGIVGTIPQKYSTPKGNGTPQKDKGGVFWVAKTLTLGNYEGGWGIYFYRATYFGLTMRV